MITLKTLPQASSQEVFDQIKEHLLTQNKKSSIEEKNETGVSKTLCKVSKTLCKYRTIQDGKTLKCAAGCLISDEEYEETMEGDPWGYLITDNKVPDNHANLIIKLQYIHDKKPAYNWPHYLNEVACEFNLKK